MGFPYVRRHQKAEGLAEDLVLRVAEGSLGGGIEELDPAPLVGHDDRFEDPFGELAVEPLRGSQRSLGPLAVGDLPRQPCIGPGQFGGALLDPAFELVVSPPQGFLRLAGTRPACARRRCRSSGHRPAPSRAAPRPHRRRRDPRHRWPGPLAPPSRKRRGCRPRRHSRAGGPPRAGGEIRVVGHVPEDRRLARPDGSAHRALATLGVGPGYADRLEITLLVASMGNGAHRLRLIVLSIADPAEAIAGDLDDDAAELPEELGLVAGPDQDMVATAEGLAGPIDPPTFADLRRQSFIDSHQFRAPLPDLPFEILIRFPGPRQERRPVVASW